MGVVTGAPSLELRGDVSRGTLLGECRQAWLDDERRFRFDHVDFEGASFVGPINFDGAEFGSATFRGATFNGPVSFAGAEFHGVARFDSVTFERTASFRKARFHGEAIFEHPEDEEEVPEWPEEVTFKRWADFRQAVFEGAARFGGAQFEGRARFRDTSFEAGTTFTGATFRRARTIGPVYVARELNLDRVAFAAPVRIRADAEVLSCKGTQFQSLTTIDIWRGRTSLEEAAFAEPSIVTGRGPLPKPRVESLNRANVANLTLADLDLRDCSFLGVHNLDGLRFEGGIEFPEMEARGRTRRRMIADEVGLRKQRAAQDRTAAERIARAYRALRKGREDNKDAPGAADFYYGEMEMRRRAARGVEKSILTLYWLVSGYGLRASRAVLALVVTVALFAAGFAGCAGFSPDQDYWKSLLFSAESTSGLVRTPTAPDGARLTVSGQIFQLGLRLLGPLFFGLALLALRGRVKR